MLEAWLLSVLPFKILTLLHSERPKLHRVLAILSAIGLKALEELSEFKNTIHSDSFLACLVAETFTKNFKLFNGMGSSAFEFGQIHLMILLI